MTETKTPTDQAIRLFHALSDETRVEIVRRLARGERCVCDLQDLLDAAQSRLSYHLRTLKDAGLVTDRREGRWIYYSIVPQALEELHAFVADLIDSAVTAPGSSGCCGVQ